MKIGEFLKRTRQRLATCLVWKLDRLARSLSQLIETVEQLLQMAVACIR